MFKEVKTSLAPKLNLNSKLLKIGSNLFHPTPLILELGTFE